MLTRSKKISAIILAGGLATRMDNQDKGLIRLGERFLVDWVRANIAPQVDEIVISANRNLDVYRGLGLPVVSDILYAGYGPLAGVYNGLKKVSGPLVLIVPCDTPFLPDDLVQRLQAQLDSGYEIAVPVVAQQTQNAVCLFDIHLSARLAEFLDAGHKKMADWQASLNRVLVPFHDANAFLNINNNKNLREAQQLLGT